jgi:hypothetical protein
VKDEDFWCLFEKNNVIYIEKGYKKNANLNIICIKDDFKNYELFVPYDNLYVVRDMNEIDEIVEFYNYYNIKTLERREK